MRLVTSLVVLTVYCCWIYIACRCVAWSNFIAIFALAMAQTENSFSDSSVGSESVMLSEYEGNNVNLDGKSVFEPYQGEPLASTSGSESSEDEEDLDGLSPSVLEKRMDKIIPISSW